MDIKQYQYYYGIAYRSTDQGKKQRSGYFKDWYSKHIKYFRDYESNPKRKEFMSEYRKLHLDNFHKAHLKYNQKIKHFVIAYYSNNSMQCKRCGFSDMRALSIDHINGNGIKHRKLIPKGIFYDWLKRSNFPDGYQVLCMNCQFIKKAENGEHRWKMKN